MPQPARSIDASFSVPQVHRIRFTQDVLGRDEQVLAELLEPSGADPVRVQFWLDENVAQAQPELTQRIRAFAHRHRRRIQCMGNVQIVPGGEAIKNDIHILERMLKVFNAADLDRRSYVVVIGGGAVLDAVGFAVAIAHRGLRLVRLPTTTLAQADSAIGVKNGVNLFHKKNWLGSFAVPWGVVNDASLLTTLSDRDFRAGFSEAVKVALLKDPDFLESLCGNAAAIARRSWNESEEAIYRSAELHLRHITAGGDPFEAREARPLDYGHWSAHRIEALTEFDVRHGEAVAIGVAIDTVYSSLVHGFPEKACQRVLHCLEDLGFELDHPVLHDTEAIFEGLEEFRQHLGGRLTLTVLEDVGRPRDVHEVNWPRMQEAIERVQSSGSSMRSSEQANLKSV